MRWLEIVRLRAPATDREAVLAELARRVAALRTRSGLVELAVFSHARVEGDLAVHLVWAREGPAHGTDPGRELAESLRSFGLVDHSAWQEEQS